MSDHIALVKQRQCTDLGCEDENYIVDIFSYMQPERHGHNESRKQLFVFITRAVENNRSEFLQEEKTRLGMIKVYSDKFIWSKTREAGTLIAKVEMGDFEAVRKIERRKIDEMRLPEKVTYTLPFCDASAMKIVAKLLSGSPDDKILLETEQLNVKLSMIPQCETKPAVEHETSQPSEQTLVPEEHVLKLGRDREDPTTTVQDEDHVGLRADEDPGGSTQILQRSHKASTLLRPSNSTFKKSRPQGLQSNVLQRSASDVVLPKSNPSTKMGFKGSGQARGRWVAIAKNAPASEKQLIRDAMPKLQPSKESCQDFIAMPL